MTHPLRLLEQILLCEFVDSSCLLLILLLEIFCFIIFNDVPVQQLYW